MIAELHHDVDVPYIIIASLQIWRVYMVVPTETSDLYL